MKKYIFYSFVLIFHFLSNLFYDFKFRPDKEAYQIYIMCAVQSIIFTLGLFAFFHYYGKYVTNKKMKKEQEELKGS